MSQEWNIKPRSEVCLGCKAPFDDGQVCVSALVFGEEGYARVDHCESCWAQKAEAVSPYSVWQGIYQAPPPKAEEAVKKETAESLLRRLMEEDTEARQNAIYILAVMLERKKILVERDVKWDGAGTKTLVYEHRKTGEMFLVCDPGLQLDQLEPVQQEIMSLLGGPSNDKDNVEGEEEPPQDGADSHSPPPPDV